MRMQTMGDCCTIFALGFIAFFCFMAGAVALGLFGLGAVVYGVVLLPQEPAKSVALILVGSAILSLFARSGRSSVP